jgi:hypothetical protein
MPGCTHIADVSAWEEGLLYNPSASFTSRSFLEFDRTAEKRTLATEETTSSRTGWWREKKNILGYG